jgi:hypothetical protein
MNSVSNRSFIPNRASEPKLMAGAPTGYLSPQIPPPTDYVVPLGLEIAPGLGISLDARAILVGLRSDGASQKLDIVGHLDDGTYPQRDYKVSTGSGAGSIDGKYAWQDYSMTKVDSKVVVVGDEARRSFESSESQGLPQTVGKMPAKTFTTTREGDAIVVKPGWEGGPSFKITQDGATTKVDTGSEDTSFTFTKNNDGSYKIDGKLNPQDFAIKPQGSGWLVQGYYPQQKYVIKDSVA